MTIQEYELIDWHRQYDTEAIKLIAHSLGPGRFARSAYRARRMADGNPALACLAMRHGTVVGCVQAWPVTATTVSNTAPPSDASHAESASPEIHSCETTKQYWLLGPLVVSPQVRKLGIGTALIQTVLDRARNHVVPTLPELRTLSDKEHKHGQQQNRAQARSEHLAGIVLVGDASYYGRFGFVATSKVCFHTLMPTDPRRILVREITPYP